MNIGELRHAQPEYDPKVCLAASQLDMAMYLPGGHTYAPFVKDLLTPIEDPQAPGGIRLALAPTEHALDNWRAENDGQPMRTDADIVAAAKSGKEQIYHAGQSLAQVATKHGLGVERSLIKPGVDRALRSFGWITEKFTDGEVTILVPKLDSADYFQISLDALFRADPEATQGVLAKYFTGVSKQMLARTCVRNQTAHRRKMSQFTPVYYNQIADHFRHIGPGAQEQLAYDLSVLASLPTLVRPEHSQTIGQRLLEGLSQLDEPHEVSSILGRLVLEPGYYLDHRIQCPAESAETRDQLASYGTVHFTQLNDAVPYDNWPRGQLRDALEQVPPPTDSALGLPSSMHPWLSPNDLRNIHAVRGAAGVPAADIKEVQALLHGLTWAVRDCKLQETPGLRELVDYHLGPANPALKQYVDQGWDNLWHPGSTN